MGLVTREDLLECIFGEIHSPSDERHQATIKDLGEGLYRVDGKIPVTEFNQAMGSDFSDEWGETIGGLLLHHYGELPHEGAKVEVGDFLFTVSEVEENRMKVVEFQRTPKAAEQEDHEE